MAGAYRGYQAYGPLFHAIHDLYKPQLVVELGGGVGFTLMTLGRAAPRVVCVGMPERVPDNVEVYRQDAINQDIPHGLDRIDLLIVDLDNDGAKLEKVRHLWFPRVNPTGLIVIEGGFSSWPDKPRNIPQFLDTLRHDGFQVFTFPNYPGMSLVRHPEFPIKGA